MDDLYSRIVGQRGSVERLFERLPGFRGYLDMSARRQADRMMREHVASQLQMQHDRLPSIENTLLDSGGLSYMNKTRNAKSRFQTLIDRIATDTPGYSGFFDALKIGTEELEIIYAFDEAMLRYANQYKEKIDALQAAAAQNENFEEALTALEALTAEANEAYGLRDNVLTGIE